MLNRRSFFECRNHALSYNTELIHSQDIKGSGRWRKWLRTRASPVPSLYGRSRTAEAAPAPSLMKSKKALERPALLWDRRFEYQGFFGGAFGPVIRAFFLQSNVMSCSHSARQQRRFFRLLACPADDSASGRAANGMVIFGCFPVRFTDKGSPIREQLGVIGPPFRCQADSQRLTVV